MRAVLIKTCLRILAVFPLAWNYRLATRLGKWIARHPNWRIASVTRTNIELCFPDLPASEQQRWIEKSIIETCKTFVELGTLWLWRSQKTLSLVKKVSNEDCLQQALAQDKGVILLTPHFGAWEMAGLYASKHYPMTALYRPPKLLGLNQFILDARQRASGRYVATDKTGIKALYQTLKQQQVIGILPDQVPSRGNGVFAPFFNQPADTMVLVARFASKTQAPVIFTFAERLDDGFHIHFFPAHPDINSSDLAISTQALNQGVEHCIMQQPTQYQWSYKRFKHVPEGQNSIYD
ncbi:lysophospholipid acyltransferase family protein [Candidatus Albibeggiatoa sp. nov. BB20]|uniref:lysophospholipid acyltransferase family protein n=1 Tax=Candidatus Albibeggiatoa sp. nov. BB20 TaxID=3162723 RepID=UPI003365925E